MHINSLFKLLGNLYHPEDAGGVGTVSDIDAMKDDNTNDDNVDDNIEDNDTDESDVTDDDSSDDSADKDGDEEEVEEDTEDDGDDELDTARLTEYTDIKKAYPDFFKKFPDVRAALFRDSRYAEILGSPEDAETAVKKASALDNIEQALLVNGDASALLNTIKAQSPEAFERIAMNFLPELNNANKELYLEVVALPIKQLLRHAWREGKGKDTDLGRAAAYIHHHFFNDTNIDGKIKAEGFSTKEETQTERELRSRLEHINTRETVQFNNSVDESYIKRTTNILRESLDKDDRLSEYTKKNLIKDCLQEIKSRMVKDPRHLNTMGSLFKQAKSAGYTNDFKSRIVAAGLARAKALIPEVRKKLVAEAITASKKTSTGEGKKKQFTGKVVSKNTTSTSKSTNKDGKALTDLDILRSA